MYHIDGQCIEIYRTRAHITLLWFCLTANYCICATSWLWRARVCVWKRGRDIVCALFFCRVKTCVKLNVSSTAKDKKTKEKHNNDNKNGHMKMNKTFMSNDLRFMCRVGKCNTIRQAGWLAVDVFGKNRSKHQRPEEQLSEQHAGHRTTTTTKKRTPSAFSKTK